ncbi:Translation machinery associated TMA7 [Moelleriella libera RCEF 2490]|uniref:Translation machinery associated TMA7 n=1 Tax=Moelleriella libera RCEF 2490 TaxID=1081109 RepID=A0A162IV48_9HYPO|nr:Translation machinery associated TMA7 [Moelleriella libera RCEF 2490]
MGGQNRENGKAKPMKAPKKKAAADVDSDDERARQKMKEDEAARKAMANQIAGKKGPLNTGSQGIKKSGKK